MVLVPHHACITRTLKRLFLLACCFLFLNSLLQEVVKPRDDKGKPWVRKRQKAGGNFASLHFPANKPEKTGTKGSSITSLLPIPIQSKKTFPTKGGESQSMTVSTSHQKNLQEVFPRWMCITDNLYIYSAFWDVRQNLPTGAVVRMLGIIRYHRELMEDISKYQWSGKIRKDALNYSCFLWYAGDFEEGQLSAFIYEEGLKLFVGTYFLCSPKKLISNSSNPKFDESRVPYAVSLVPHGVNNTSHKLIYLTHPKKKGQGDGNHSGVCVRPLFGPYSDLAAIALFISYYSTVLKVSHFYFYDFAINKRVREFLMLLMADGEISIHLLPWNIPFSEWETLWDLGSLTSTNDCIYRNSGQHSHVAVVDLDEFIVPEAPISTLGQLYTSVIKHKRGQEGDSVLILNVFFCSEFQEGNKVGNSSDFSVFRATFREERLWPSKLRSKMIVVPETVIAVGHHMVHCFLKPVFKNQASPKLLAKLHHYRNCHGLRMGIHATGSEVLNQKPVRDSSILKYKKDLLTSRTISQYFNFIKKH